MKNILKFYNNIFVFTAGFLIVIFTMSLSISCTHSNDVLSTMDTVCFETDILPIFETNCALSGCHDKVIGRMHFTDYPSIMAGIKPSDPEESEIYQAITDPWEDMMPPAPYQLLAKEQRNLIYIWIKQGAKNSICNN